MTPEHFLSHCLVLDLETAPDGTVLAVGAACGAAELRRERPGAADWQALAQLAAPARALLGHNLLGHDVPVLRAVVPGLTCLRLPVVDTLYLSPLAFPENPYHRLVKDYKLVRDSLNDPLADARLAGRVFSEQWQVLSALGNRSPDILALYRYCLAGAESGGGFELLFEALGVAPMDAARAFACLRDGFRERVCRTAFQRMVMVHLADPARRPALAYAVAWLRVAGGNSVLPPWVRQRFPDTVAVLRQLRDVPCEDAQCSYCRELHDPPGQLRRYFGFQAFRALPTNAGGGSLQQDIITAALGDRPLLAILPTGGGKSLCFQLPALVRHQRRGLLTVVISPLQALMKDQVDGLSARTGSPTVAALYGMLTGPERGEVLERVRLGDIAILYVSPEQFRNRGFRDTIAQREIGAWVFDEAHCLSKWGHDFRPDYLYCGRFIKRFAAEQKLPIPPVQCFTATAKQDVIQEILDHFGAELGQPLSLFQGGVERTNLHFEVQTVNRAEKPARIQQLLAERLGEGSAIVFCATRRRSEEIAGALCGGGWAAAFFHARLEAPEKRRIQDAFLAGEIRVICATNAFGMGIDKDNVRLVIHAEIPGSLENYLQEAGRAGRDREDADCVLLYDQQDVEQQFNMGAMSQLSQRDIQQILRGLRRARRNREGEVVLTAGDLLRMEVVETGFDSSDSQAETRVRAAIAWLERAGFVERSENRSRSFQGRPLVRDLAEARQRISALNLSARQQRRWLAILQALMNTGIDEILSADTLAELGAFRRETDEPAEDTETQRVLRTLHDMAEAGLIRQHHLLTAFVRHKVVDASPKILVWACELERAMLAALREADPDADDGQWRSLSLRVLNQQLLDKGLRSNPDTLRTLLKGLGLDGRGLAGQQGSLQLRYRGLDSYQIRLQRRWDSILSTVQRRQEVARLALALMLEQLPAAAPAGAALQVEFAVEDILARLKTDPLLAPQIRDPLAAVERALVFLHELKAVDLQGGFGVLRQAMTIRVLPEARGRRYNRGDYQTLSQHYQEQVFQVHVMNEFARRGLEKISQALALALAYFSLGRLSFVQRFFAGRAEMLARATTEESHRRIVEALGNPEQMAVVAARETDNLLILAGPGSGKTRVVVHRCAYLIRVRRQPARSILVLCFNRQAALEIRRRLVDLLGDEARGILVYTYHGLALRLTGHSLAARAEVDGAPALDFEAILREAVALLEGSQVPPGLEADEVRDRLLGGFAHILVDEYQDIDEQQYRLVSAIAGRTLADPETRLAILAVGDDDQNIYQFRGTNVAFIRRMEQDYRASRHYLAENYRSSGHIVATANMLIQHNQDRMKTDQPLRVNRARGDLPAGANWLSLDPLAQGRVQILRVTDVAQQARVLVTELLRLRGLGNTPWSRFAVLGRTWEVLVPLRAVLEACGVPVLSLREQRDLPPPRRVRAVARLLDELHENPGAMFTVADLLARLDAVADPWQSLLVSLLEDWSSWVAETATSARQISEFLHEGLLEAARDGLPGEGVRLATAHAVKGMEFDHVLIADGGWASRQPADLEAERRLYYVAMTRARETLVLAEGLGANPHAALLEGESVLRRSGVEELPGLDPDAVSLRYTVLGLWDLYLSFAAGWPADDPIHQRLAALTANRSLQLEAWGDRLVLATPEGPVAALSAKATGHWRSRLPGVLAVRVLAMVRWHRTDSEAAYHGRCQVDSWEVPVVELIHRSTGDYQTMTVVDTA